MNARLSTDDLLALVPAVHRTRDADRGVLAGLLEVLAGQAAHVEDDLVALLDDWFVETCAEWVVPYLGDLLAARPLHDAGGLLSQRAWVAGTVAYRRRKGTLAMLESLGRAVTGWPMVAVEFHRRLSSTQHLDHARTFAATADLRARGDLHAGVVDGPFDPAPHLADVRSIAADRGRHNVAHVGLFVWRQAGAWLPRATLRPVADPPDGRYHVHPLGLDLPLHHRAAVSADDADLATEADVPVALRRRPTYDEVTARRQATVDGDPPPPARWFGTNPAFTVRVRAAPGDPLVAVPPDEVTICDLADPGAPLPTGWRRPPATVDVAPTAGGPPVALPITVGVDPALGRVAFPDGVTPDHVEISAHVGVLADTAGGPYSRAAEVGTVLAQRPPTWQLAVSAEEAPVPGQVVATLGEAVSAWNAQPDGTVGVIAVADSHRYAEELVAGGRIRVGEGSFLLVVAAGWPATPVPGGLPGETQRLVGSLDATERRPVLVGDVEVDGTAPAGSQTPGVLVWDGVWVDGAVTAVAAGGAGLRRLELRHTTVTGGVSAESGHVRCEVALAACATGPVALDGDVARLSAADTVLVAGGGAALDAAGVAVALDRVTVMGTAAAQTLEAGDCIFVDPVTVARRQTGCVRYSWVPRSSATPRRHRCQPDLAVEDLPPADADVVAARTAPAFTSVNLGDPTLGDLQRTVAAAISAGAADGGAMGALGLLGTTHRLANLAAGLDEYLPVGLAAGVVFVT